ncbi:MAG: hypothetical protein RLY31_1152 [Bacteroidota bacterium]|jgi:type IX secretion system PorP/SprF family membrane protein
MKHIIASLGFIGCLFASATAQQDPMFTKYMFNTLNFNPAYAGARDYLSIAVIHRSQWQEIPGAPTTQTLTMHTPLRNNRVGIGFGAARDAIGSTRTTGANLAYSYRIPFGKFKFCFGLQAGLQQFNADFDGLRLDNPSDPAFEGYRGTMPNIGAGFYLYSERFYFGISSPRLVENDLRRNISTNAFARQERHFYLATGAAISLRGDAIIFKPSLLVRNVGIDNRISQDVFFSGVGAPDAFDLDLSFLFQETLWLGAAFRSAFSAPILSTDPKSSYDSADIWISYLFRNGLRIGAAYDFPISDLANVTVGSVELMVGYDFNFQEKRIVTPRYF